MDLSAFWLSFVPLFIAVDPVGVLPMFISLTQDVEERQMDRLVLTSVATATVVALAFLFGGAGVLGALGVTMTDFSIAGGILLFIISMNDLLVFEKKRRKVDPAQVGVVPVAMPLVSGPAVLTTVVLLAGEFGRLPVLAALMANMLLTGVIFLAGRRVYPYLGKSGAVIISKIASLLLASIAVMLVRRAVMQIVAGV